MYEVIILRCLEYIRIKFEGKNEVICVYFKCPSESLRARECLVDPPVGGRDR